jgi:hypothetical protein
VLGADSIELVLGVVAMSTTLPLGEDLRDDIPVHVGQAMVTALELEREPRVVDA